MKKQNLPKRTFLANFAMQTTFLFFLFVNNICSQVVIEEKVEINPDPFINNNQTSFQSYGWWIGGCYFENYDSAETNLAFTPSAIEPGETAIMTVGFNEELHNLLERNITLEPNLGTLVRMPPGGSPLIFDFNVDWDHPNPGFICGGDELTLRIEYKGVKKNFKLNTDILGDNPVDKETFRTYVSTKLTDPKDKHMNVVLYFETQFRQFWTDHYVYMNTDNPPEVDWGVCQVRKITPTIGEIWNWKENINSGIDIFNKKYNEAINYPPNQRTEKRWKRWYKIIYNNLTDFTTDEQKFKETHHLYRGGHYWHWFPVDEQNPDSQGEWKPDPQNNHNRGEDAWIIYQRVKNNDPPEGWNN